MQYVVKEDIIVADQTIATTGETFEEIDGFIEVNTSFGSSMKFDVTKSSKFFKAKNDIDVRFKEIDSDDDAIKTWRLQLDVKTTRTNAKKIEKYLKESLANMI